MRHREITFHTRRTYPAWSRTSMITAAHPICLATTCVTWISQEYWRLLHVLAPHAIIGLQYTGFDMRRSCERSLR